MSLPVAILAISAALSIAFAVLVFMSELRDAGDDELDDLDPYPRLD